MEIIINGKQGFNETFIHDIIGKNIENGDSLMFTNGEAILYARIKDELFLKLSKKESLDEPIDFLEYNEGKAKK